MKKVFKKGLCLLFVMCLVLSGAGCMEQGEKPTVYVMGDSTARTYDVATNVTVGWGQVLHSFFEDSYIVDNSFAKSGESAHRCYDTWWNDLKPNIKKGDYVLIQFGHNDSKKTKKDADGNTIFDSRWGDPTLGSDVKPEAETNTHSYKWYLRQFIEYIDSQGAYPILVTSIERRNHVFQDEEKSPLYSYVNAMKELSLELADEEIMGKGNTIHVPVIDMWSKVRAKVSEMGEEGSKAWYVIKHYVEGDTSAENKKLKDNTHLVREGALEFSRMLADELKEIAKTDKVVKGLAKYLVDDIANAEDKGELPPKETESPKADNK